MTPETRLLRPKRGLDLPLEDGSPWPKEGKEVEVTRYVRRRIADGDVVEVEPEADQADAPPAPEPAASETDKRAAAKAGAKNSGDK